MHIHIHIYIYIYVYMYIYIKQLYSSNTSSSAANKGAWNECVVFRRYWQQERKWRAYSNTWKVTTFQKCTRKGIWRQGWNIGIPYKRAYALSSHALTYVALKVDWNQIVKNPIRRSGIWAALLHSSEHRSSDKSLWRLRPMHVARVHVVRIPGSRNSRASLC